MVEIKCINKDDNHITHIGGINKDLTRWKITQKQAIDYISSGKYNFYVNILGDKVNVIVSKRNGVEYIKTENDGDIPNNLLSLNSCPIVIKR